MNNLVPVTSGIIAPQVKPNEWNSGNTIMNLSWIEKSITDLICAILAKILLCECTTPLGLPSEPEVNKTTAGSDGFECAAANLGNHNAKPMSHALSHTLNS